MPFERIYCPRCSENFGQEIKFIGHLSVVHNISSPSTLFNEIYYEGRHPTCSCSAECNSLLIWHGWKKGYTSKFSRGHNVKLDSVYKDPVRQKEFSKKRREGYSAGRYKVWNAGLTKESDSRIRQQSIKAASTILEGYASGRLQDWRISDPVHAAASAEKISKTKKIKFAAGLLEPWNKGKTKFDDPRVASMSFGIKENYAENPDASSKRLSAEALNERVNSSGKFILISDPATYRNKYQKLEIKCVSCGALQRKNLMMIKNSPVCFSCAPRESAAQIEIYEFVHSLSSDAILSDRTVITPKELDVYVPSRNFGIEYNGLYWHSIDVLKDKNYHDSKHELCNAAGVKLLSIYEDEWRDKRLIVEGMIRHRLGHPSSTWNARSLIVEELPVKDARNFFDNNHLEGYVSSVITFCLRDQKSGIVLAAMTLRRPFHKKYSDQFEVGRCCVLSGHNVRGWLGRLTKAAIDYSKAHQKKGLMTYVDGRVGLGSGYGSAGWKLISSTTSGRFWWTDYKYRYNRFKYKANKVRGLSQIEIAEEAGVAMIWGCRNYMYMIQF